MEKYRFFFPGNRVQWYCVLLFLPAHPLHIGRCTSVSDYINQKSVFGLCLWFSTIVSAMFYVFSLKIISFHYILISFSTQKSDKFSAQEKLWLVKSTYDTSQCVFDFFIRFKFNVMQATKLLITESNCVNDMQRCLLYGHY